MNIPPKKRISVARNVHMPSVDADFCCGMSSNCSARAVWASGMLQFLFGFGGILVRRTGDNRDFFEVMFWRRGRSLPFKTGGVPGIGGRFLAVLQRPNEIKDRKKIADAKDRSAGAGKHVVDLEFAGISVVSSRHPEIAHDKLRKKSEVEADVSNQSGELAKFLWIHSTGDFWPPIMQASHERRDHAADHHVVEVSDDEVGVREVNVSGKRCEEQAGPSADRPVGGVSDEEGGVREVNGSGKRGGKKAGQPSDDEQADKSNRVKHGR